jgi:dTMP kinase
VATVLRPALAAGKVVLSDRYELSTLAYQVAGRRLPRAAVVGANRLATGGLRPDLTLVLDVPPAVGRRRQEAQGKTLDRLEREDAAWHARVARAFRAARGRGIVHLDATQDPEDVLEAAWHLVRRRVGVMPRERA